MPSDGGRAFLRMGGGRGFDMLEWRFSGPEAVVGPGGRSNCEMAGSVLTSGTTVLLDREESGLELVVLCQKVSDLVGLGLIHLHG